MLTPITPDSAAFTDLVGSVAHRFQRLVEEAEQKARPYYRAKLGREASIAEVISEVFTAVEREGAGAVARYAAIFDGSTLRADQLELPLSEAKAAWEAVGDDLRRAISTAIDQVTAYQRRLLPKGFGEDLSETLGVRWLPLHSVGAYVPGGGWRFAAPALNRDHESDSGQGRRSPRTRPGNPGAA